MIRKLPLILFFYGCSFFGQHSEYSGSFNLQSNLSFGTENPFWFHSNQRGRIDEITRFAGWLNGQCRFYNRSGGFVETGVGLLYSNGYNNRVMLEEYYLTYENDLLKLFAGKEHKEAMYSGLSATNQNILWSLNASPISGIGIRMKEPLMLWKQAGIGFKFSYEEYFTDDERYIDNTWIHHKSLHLVFKGSERFTLTAGVQHFAQWAGDSDEYGELPSGFDDYLRVVTGGSIASPEGSLGEQEINGLGNHLGSYEIYLNTSISHFDVELIYNTIFEDKSGMILRNTPDGRYGIYLRDREEEKWIGAFMYEFFYTKHQSHSTPTPDGDDNYFNNNLYRSGWTYEGRVLGLPFILLDEERFRIGVNNLMAHHLGISGLAFSQFPYKFLTSYRKNYGRKSGTSEPTEEIVSTYLEVQLLNNYFNFDVLIGGDFNSEEDPILGLGIRLKRVLF